MCQVGLLLWLLTFHFGSGLCLDLWVCLMLWTSSLCVRMNTFLAIELMSQGRLSLPSLIVPLQGQRRRCSPVCKPGRRLLGPLVFATLCSGAHADLIFPGEKRSTSSSASCHSLLGVGVHSLMLPLHFSGMGTAQCLRSLPLMGWFPDASPKGWALRGVRVGEASHPGPATFEMSVIDPTGVNNKYDLISMLRPGIYALSETHLSKVAFQRFRAALRRRTTFKFVPGDPAAVRSRSSVSGAYAGVGFLSSFPTRTVAQDWDSALFESGRIAASSFFIEPMWVLGITIYGYATVLQISRVLDLIGRWHSQQGLDLSLGISTWAWKMCPTLFSANMVSGTFRRLPRLSLVGQRPTLANRPAVRTSCS